MELFKCLASLAQGYYTLIRNLKNNKKKLWHEKGKGFHSARSKKSFKINLEVDLDKSINKSIIKKSMICVCLLHWETIQSTK